LRSLGSYKDVKKKIFNLHSSRLSS
jgi:hypothetical protein